MPARNYGQACSVATFLDSLGTRWTLLIVRDLLIGKRRFKDLLDGLPGIGTNLLTQRLKELTNLGVITKTNDQNKAQVVYQLTQAGLALEPIILAMAKWGWAHLKDDGVDKINRSDLLVVAFRAAFNPQQAENMKESYEIRIDDLIFHIHIANGTIATGLGAAQSPDLIYMTDQVTFDQIVTKSLSSSEAIETGKLKVMGDQQTLTRFESIFSKS